MIKKRQYVSFDPEQLIKVDALVKEQGLLDRATLVRIAINDYLAKHANP